MTGPKPAPMDPDFGPEVPPPPPPPGIAPDHEGDAPDFLPEVPPPPPPPSLVDPDATIEIEPIRESSVPKPPRRPDVHDAVIIDRGAAFRGSRVVARGVRSGLAMIITGR